MNKSRTTSKKHWIFGYSLLGFFFGMITLFFASMLGFLFLSATNDQQSSSLASTIVVSILGLGILIAWFSIRNKIQTRQKVGIYARSIYFGWLGWALVLLISITSGWVSYMKTGPSGNRSILLEGQLSGEYWKIDESATLEIDASIPISIVHMKVYSRGNVPEGRSRPNITITLGNSICSTESRSTSWIIDRADQGGSFGEIEAYCEPYVQLQSVEELSFAEVKSAKP